MSQDNERWNEVKRSVNEARAIVEERHGSLSRAAGSTPFAPLAVRLSFDANRCTPSLASMIARVLRDAGATVTFGDNAAEMPEKPVKTLEGLRVHIDRLTWVCDEEADRWKDREANPKLTDPKDSV